METKTPSVQIARNAAPTNIGHLVARVQQMEPVTTVKRAHSGYRRMVVAAESQTPSVQIARNATPTNIGHQIAAVRQTEPVTTVKYASMVNRRQKNAENPLTPSVRNARSAHRVKPYLLNAVKIKMLFV